MAVAINNLSKKAWDRFIKEGMTKAAAAGILGNIFAESGMQSAICEYLCLQRLKENGKNYTQESYLKAVNSGKISRAEFLNPLPNRQYGYGMCQWTTPVPRKSELYDRTVGKGLSIGDEDTQIEYLIYELKTRYPSVWKVLTTTNSVKEASDKVLKDFEIPDNWSQYSALRAGYGQEYYNAYANTTTTATQAKSSTKADAINALIATAKAEIGYLEKRSNANLDDKTANAGSGNYTKYWRDVYPSYQAQPWCACFVSWCMMKTFGLETAKKLLKHWPYVYCPTLGTLFTKNSNPKVGDIVIFYRNGEFAHTGLVINVNGDQFTTIEGNTSGGSTIIANGGGVCQKTYYNSNLPGTKFCTPDYSIVTGVKAQTTSTTTQTTKSTPKAWSGVTKKRIQARTWAGVQYPEVSFSPLKKGTPVEVQYSIKDSNGAEWHYFKTTDNKYAFIPANSVEANTAIAQGQYRVQSGSFAEQANAEKQLAIVKQAGLDAILEKTSGGYYVVQLGMFSKLANANKLKKQAQEAGIDVAVVKL